MASPSCKVGRWGSGNTVVIGFKRVVIHCLGSPVATPYKHRVLSAWMEARRGIGVGGAGCVM